MTKGLIIYDSSKGRAKKLTRQHISWFRNNFLIKKYNLMTIREIREKFLNFFKLDSKLITVFGLRKSLKKKVEI